MSESFRPFELDPTDVERSPSRRTEQEPIYWLEEFINPSKLAERRRMPIFEDSTDEGIVLHSLLATIVEKAGDMDPQKVARLRNVIGVFRLLAVANMNDQEREQIEREYSSGAFDPSKLVYEVNDEVRADIAWIWNTFEFVVPKSYELEGRINIPSGLLNSPAEIRD